MASEISKLCELAGPPLVVQRPRNPDVGLPGLSCLRPLLDTKNGFLCFGGALHVFHADGHHPILPSLGEWNELDGWRSGYGALIPSEVLFFAQDIFGGQFAIDAGEVFSFDPETAEFEKIASSVREWCGLMLLDWRFLTGYPLLEDWEKAQGPLEIGRRLVPKVPFCLGGGFSVENVYPEVLAKALRSRAEIAKQVHALPDGSSVRLSTD